MLTQMAKAATETMALASPRSRLRQVSGGRFSVDRPGEGRNVWRRVQRASSRRCTSSRVIQMSVPRQLNIRSCRSEEG